jgi:hypothetical protein
MEMSMNHAMHRLFPSAATLAVLVGVAAPAGWGAGSGAGPVPDRQKKHTPFEEAQLFFELNSTDGDLGLHSAIDGDEWKQLDIEDPNERELLNILVSGKLRKQGMTELNFESGEPPFDELPPAKFLRRFPAGKYEISGITLDGKELESVVEVSHVIPAPPQNILLSGQAAAENCDADPLPSVAAPVTISWDPVKKSHPDIGDRGAVKIAQYQLVLEREEPTLLVFSVDLPPEVTSFEIPQGFTNLGDSFKFEILVRDANGNRTAVESCFELQQE